MKQQSTLYESTPELHGVNVFTGKDNHIRFHPAPSNCGISFIVNGERIPARIEQSFLHKSPRSLWLSSAIGIQGRNERALHIEHVMADVVASGVDNLDIALSDGVGTRFDYDSNRAVVELLERKSECDTEKRTYRVKRGLSESERTVTQEGKTDSIAVEPSGGFFIDYRAGFPHASIGEQHYRFEVDSDSYQEDIMPARAIFFMPYFIPEPFLRRAIQPHYGVTDRNALMVGRRHEKQFRNRELPEGIYGNEEFVRHKIMDALGAIGLMGMQFVDTTFSFFKTGHGFDLYGLRELQTREIFEQVH